MARPNEQINDTDRLDKIRTELDGKIEKKVPQWVLGMLIVIVLAAFSFVGYQISSVAEDVKDINDRIIVIETKLYIKR